MIFRVLGDGSVQSLLTARSRKYIHPRRLRIQVDDLSPYAANLCPIPCGGAVSHTRLRTTILHSEGRDCKRYFERPDGEPWEAAQTALQGSRWVRQFERKEEMRPINWTFSVSSN